MAVVQGSGRTPSAAVLDEVSGLSLGVQLDIPDVKVADAAEQILAGSLSVPRFLQAPMSLQGYPQDYRRGPPTLQLIMASLEVERVLLGMFERTHDPRFLDLAVSRILAFAAHESQQRQGDGFLWNDHAVGARISVLAKLWRHVRERADFPPASSLNILSLVERSGRMLAKPSQFTVRTNHGVVQNLALLQIAAAFPALPESPAWRRLAVERLKLQLPFYVSGEGAVLEHSAEYHLFGSELLAMAVRLSVLNGLVPDPVLVEAAQKTRGVLGLLMRPDGSLPLLGNTSAGKTSAMPLTDPGGATPIRHQLPPYSPPESGSTLLPVSGYAIWWHSDDARKLAQTLVAWAKHDGHGHKHADEGSVLFWSEGVNWITNTGYWPYGVRNEEAAYSWAGSNAPHQLGEGFAVPRSAQLLQSGDASGLRFVEIERRNDAEGTQFRRQVAQIDAQTLLVLDFVQAAAKGTETIWTIDPALRLLPGATDRSYVSTPAPDGRQLLVSLASDSAARPQIRRGSERPFAGWVVVNDKPTPADALQVVDPGPNSTNAVLFRLAAGPIGVVPKISIETGAKADAWTVMLEGAGEFKRLTRSGEGITLDKVMGAEAAVGRVVMPLRPAPDIAAERAALKSAYAKAVAAYPPWRELAFYRQRLTYALGLLALLVEAGWFAFSRWARPITRRQYLYSHLAMTAGWVAVSGWAFLLYLR
ncbi:heparinase II/III family protein [Rhodoferax sp.]|uniref:heparinase II/III domain-containing protein n=1 Tax=Rhodoferax sp. TaxID=50421 RepID=UPI00272D1E62|nr:heparinase II/III family protein [Rhodoferax sp.]